MKGKHTMNLNSTTITSSKRIAGGIPFALTCAVLTVTAAIGSGLLNPGDSTQTTAAPASRTLSVPQLVRDYRPALTIVLVDTQAAKEAVLVAQNEAARERDAVGASSHGIYTEVFVAGTPEQEQEVLPRVNELLESWSAASDDVLLVDRRAR
jgi:hypothetical protein